VQSVGEFSVRRAATAQAAGGVAWSKSPGVSSLAGDPSSAKAERQVIVALLHHSLEGKRLLSPRKLVLTFWGAAGSMTHLGGAGLLPRAKKREFLKESYRWLLCKRSERDRRTP
jgi:hypothetical protein